MRGKVVSAGWRKGSRSPAAGQLFETADKVLGGDRAPDGGGFDRGSGRIRLIYLGLDGAMLDGAMDACRRDLGRHVEPLGVNVITRSLEESAMPSSSRRADLWRGGRS